MALSVISQTSGTVATTTPSAPPTQIAINATFATNDVIYTVPEGRVFNGYITPSVKINGAQLIASATGLYSFSTSNTTRPPITLVSGTVLTAGGSSIIELFGVESDA